MSLAIVDKWFLVRADGLPAVRVYCPSCDVGALLDHEVGPHGEVWPSLDCPNCNFHEHVKLKHWDAWPAVAFNSSDPSMEFRNVVAGHCGGRHQFLEEAENLNRVLNGEGDADA